MARLYKENIDMTSPLSNVKVLELAVAIAGPSCAGTLADWGASVTRINHMEMIKCNTFN